MEMQQQKRGDGERTGGFMITRTGVKLHPLDIRIADIRVEDIAHGLSHLCRFGGHTIVFYSVAQHSVLVSEVVESLLSAGEYPEIDTPRARIEAVKWGLVHDAVEALGLVDLPAPVKHAPELAGYRAIEKRAEAVLAEALGLPAVIPNVVKRADNIMLATEHRDLMRNHADVWTKSNLKGIEPLTGKISAWTSQLAKERFLERWDQLHVIDAAGGLR